MHCVNEVIKNGWIGGTRSSWFELQTGKASFQLRATYLIKLKTLGWTLLLISFFFFFSELSVDASAEQKAFVVQVQTIESAVLEVPNQKVK